MQNPFPDFGNKPRTLGDGDELIGGNIATQRVRPAKKGLESIDPARFHVNLGLIMDIEFIA